LVWPLPGFVIGSKQYRDANFGQWTGFYDWLRDSKEQVLGVRYWPFEDTEFLIDFAKGLAYVSTDLSRYIEIYFSGQRNAEPNLSSDQDFSYDAIFRSDEGEYAIGFGAEALSEADVLSFGGREVEWAVARPLE